MRRLFPVFVLLALIGTPSVAGASTITLEFESFAPAGSSTTENNSLRSEDGYQIGVPHGHYIDSLLLPTLYPPHTTDFLLADTVGDVLIRRQDGSAFTAFSLDVSEYNSGFALGSQFDVVGILAGGGSVVQGVTLDAVFAFQTVTLSSSFTNLVELRLRDPQGQMAYDNVVLSSSVAAPEPGSLILLGSGLGLIMKLRRRKKQNAPIA